MYPRRWSSDQKGGLRLDMPHQFDDWVVLRRTLPGELILIGPLAVDKLGKVPNSTGISILFWVIVMV